MQGPFPSPGIWRSAWFCFGSGVAGFVYRKSVITVFMSIELMLNAVNLSFIAFLLSAGSASTVTSIRFLSWWWRRPKRLLAWPSF